MSRLRFEQGLLRAGFGQSREAWFEQVIGVVEQGIGFERGEVWAGLGRNGHGQAGSGFEQGKFEKGRGCRGGGSYFILVRPMIG